MDKLKQTIPNIIKQALSDEDEITRELMLVLLNEVYSNPNKESQKKTAQRALDDFIKTAYDLNKSGGNYGI